MASPWENCVGFGKNHGGVNILSVVVTTLPTVSKGAKCRVVLALQVKVDEGQIADSRRSNVHDNGQDHGHEEHQRADIVNDGTHTHYEIE